jgi:hypothetical protein
MRIKWGLLFRLVIHVTSSCSVLYMYASRAESGEKKPLADWNGKFVYASRALDPLTGHVLPRY